MYDFIVIIVIIIIIIIIIIIAIVRLNKYFVVLQNIINRPFMMNVDDDDD